MSQVDIAVSRFNEGFSCSQAILSTFGPQFGLSEELAYKIAAPFGAGIARTGATCGAISGALMVIGLKHGATKAQDRVSKENTYTLVREFLSRFQSRNHSTLCRELLGCDIGTPEGMQTAKEKKVLTTVCPKVVQDAAEILIQLLKL